MKIKSLIKKSVLGLIFAVLAMPTFSAHAGSVHYGYRMYNVDSAKGSSVAVGEYMYISIVAFDINGLDGGLAAMQADITYDPAFIEYAGKENGSAGLDTGYGTSTQRLIVYSPDGKTVSSGSEHNPTEIIRLKFKALKESPNTKPTLFQIHNIKSSDKNGTTHTSIISSNFDGMSLPVIIGSVPTTPSNPGNNNPSDNGGNTGTPSNPGNNSGNTGSTGNTGNTGSTNSGTSSTGNSGNSGSSSYSRPTNSTAPASSDNKLARLLVNNARMNPSFSKNVNLYNVVVPAGTDMLSLDYEASDPEAVVQVKGNNNLRYGDSVVEIVVEAEDGSRNTYILNVEVTSDEASNKLRSMVVGEGNIFPAFDPNVYSYSINVGSDVRRLTIAAVAEDRDSTIEIIDNDDLDKKSKGVVLVKVTDRTGYSNYYKLNVGSSRFFDFLQNKFAIAVIAVVLIFALFALLYFILKKREQKREAMSGIDLFDNIVTPAEVVAALEEYSVSDDDTKLDILIHQDKANKMKEKRAKEELVEAVTRGDKKEIKRLQKDLEDSHGNLTPEDEQIRDQLIEAIKKDDTALIKNLLMIEKHREEK